MLSVCIVNFNSNSDLYRCIKSLTDHLPRGCEILVFDNNSCERPSLLAPPHAGVRVFYADRNIGFARAHNLLISKAVNELVLVLNPDTLLTGRLDDALKFFDSRKQWAIMSTLVTTPDGKRHSNFRKKLDLFNVVLSRSFLKHVFKKSYDSYMFPDPGQFDWITGSIMFIRKSCFKSCGFFDPAYFLYCEDVDICYKARSLGLEMGIFPEVKFVHHYNRLSNNLFSRAFLYHVSSYFKLLGKWA